MPSNTLANKHQQQRLALLLKQAQTASRLAIVSALVAIGIFAPYGHWTFLACWLTATIGISVLRIGLFRRYNTQPETRSTQQWLALHKWTGVFAGFSWGLISLYPVAALPGALQTLPLLIPAMVATAAITSYGVELTHYRAFLLALIITMLGGHAAVGAIESLPAQLIFLIIGGLLFITARRYHDSLSEANTAHEESAAYAKELEEAHRHLAEQQDVIASEEAIARHVFEQLTLTSENDIPGVYTWNQAMGSLSGDLIQVAHGPEGQTYVFLGDFTGHGLPAALGAVPASTVFKTMAEKGLPVPVIAKELNKKLHDLLPVGYFCCAAVLELSADRSKLQIWSGGLPPLMLRNSATGQLTQIPSDHLPLGVVDDDGFDSTDANWHLNENDSVYLYTDGLTEAENIDGEMWGKDRFVAFLNRDDLPMPRLDALKDQVLDFTNLAPPSDDISIIEIEATPEIVSQNAA